MIGIEVDSRLITLGGILGVNDPRAVVVPSERNNRRLLGSRWRMVLHDGRGFIGYMTANGFSVPTAQTSVTSMASGYTAPMLRSLGI